MRRSTRIIASGLVAAAAFALPAMVGCMPSKPAGDKPKTGDAAHDEHDHPAEGPHGGQLIELGSEEYHAELVHDEKAKKITVFVLDSKAKNAVPTTAKEVTLNLVVVGTPNQFTLAAVPQESDPAGQSSRFESTNLMLGDALDDENTKGRLNITIADKPFVGTVEHHEHGHHH